MRSTIILSIALAAIEGVSSPARGVCPTDAERQCLQQWTHGNLAAQSAVPPFSFRYRGQSSSELLRTWKTTESATSLDSDRAQQTVVRTDPETGLEIRCQSVEYSDYPAVEWVVWIKNTGSQDTPILEHLQALDVSLRSRPSDRVTVHHAKGSDASYSDFAPLSDIVAPDAFLKFGSHGRGGNRGGSPSVESLPFFDLDFAGNGVTIGIGWTAPWAAKVVRAADGAVQIQAGMEHVRLSLHPGEEIRSPRIVMLFWQGDLLRSHNLWRRFLLKHFSPYPGGKPFAGLIADANWGSWMNADRHVEEINWWGDHDLPMECYWVDAGWTDMGLGWEAHQSQQVPNPVLFPNGIKPLSDAARRRGMKFLLWMVPGSVHPAVGIGKQHPEWLGEPLRDKAYGTMVFYGLDHGNPQVNQFMIEHFSKVIDEHGVDIFRQDGGNLWPADIDPNRAGIHEVLYVQGFYGFWDGLLKAHPHLLIDNCAEGGRKIDLETIRRSIVLWRSDCQASGDFDPISNQGFNYGLLSWIPLCGAVVPTHRLTPYAFRSAYCPAILMGWPMAGVSDLKDRWSSVDLVLLRKLLQEYVAIRPYLFGDFYPLTPYSIDPQDWIAWQFDRPDLGEGMVQAFRRDKCPNEVLRCRLHGLDPAATYSVTDLDERQDRKTSGRLLLDQGLEVSIAHRPGAAVVRYKKQG